MGQKEVRQRLMIWMAHARQASSEKLIRRLSRDWVFSRGTKPSVNRVVRGGSWNNNPGNCRTANRNRNTPENRNNNNGFRVVMHFQTPSWRLARNRRVYGPCERGMKVLVSFLCRSPRGCGQIYAECADGAGSRPGERPIRIVKSCRRKMKKGAILW